MTSGRITEDELKWIAIDCDGTLAAPYSANKKGIGRPIKGARDFCQYLHESGYKIVIYTARHWGEHQEIEDWLLKYRIPFDRIECGKLLFKVLIDDRTMRFEGDWFHTMREFQHLIGKHETRKIPVHQRSSDS